MRRAEWHRREPGSELYRQNCSGQLACSKEKLDYFLRNTLSDPDRGQELGPQRAF